VSDDWQVVEEGIGNAPHLTTERYAAVNAALARLREREAQLEERVERSLNWREYDAALTARAEAAEARVKELEEEVDRIAKDRDEIIASFGGTL
jgi:seryl-tRNA synthetase